MSTSCASLAQNIFRWKKKKKKIISEEWRDVLDGCLCHSPDGSYHVDVRCVTIHLSLGFSKSNMAETNQKILNGGREKWPPVNHFGLVNFVPLNKQCPFLRIIIVNNFFFFCMKVTCSERPNHFRWGTTTPTTNVALQNAVTSPTIYLNKSWSFMLREIFIQLQI